MTKRTVFKAAALLLTPLLIFSSCVGVGNAPTSSGNSEEAKPMELTFNNKVAEGGGDPWVILHDGVYYYCYAGQGGVCVSQFYDLPDMSTAEGHLVWTPDLSQYNKEIWAPELHFIGDKWYIYVAADDGDNYHHRMLCLESRTSDPLDGFITKGVLRPETDRWAIDGTMMQYGGKLYFIWSGWEGTVNVAQNLYIAEMANPWTFASDRVMISCPEFPWEKRGGTPTINEGPTALELNGTMHIVYSASGSWCDDYCLGMLTLTGTDPLSPASWAKSESPVFEKTDSIFGPGHASFTTSPDGSRRYIVYHANEASGTGWMGRRIWIQEYTADESNAPVFGSPMTAGTMQTVPENTDKTK